jgi:hypothetical protein
MDNIKSVIIGTIVTIIIGGTAYSIDQSDIIKNFADDTGLTQEQAENYVKGIKDEELMTWKEIGSEMIDAGQTITKVANEIDCINYEYSWESVALSCSNAKKQANQLANSLILLGSSYLKLDSDSASEGDISQTIRLIDQVNSDIQLEFVIFFLGQPTINDFKKENSYNKAVLRSVLDTYYEND